MTPGRWRTLKRRQIAAIMMAWTVWVLLLWTVLLPRVTRGVSDGIDRASELVEDAQEKK